MRQIDGPWTRGIIATWLPDTDAAAVAESLAPPYRAEALRRWDEAAELWDAIGSRFNAGSGPGPRRHPRGTGRGRRSLRRARVPRPRRPVRGAEARLEGWSTPRGRRAATKAHPQGLTRREAEVATLLAEGMSNAAIADRLVLSPRTVEHHVSAVMAKLDVSSRHSVRDILVES